MRRTLIALLPLLFVVACGGDAREPATAYLDDIAAHASAFEGALATHRASVAGAASVTALASLEQGHLADATVHVGGMGHDVEGMCQCMNGQGQMMAPDAMRQLVNEAMAECARHDEAMAAAADMHAAMLEEDHYQAAMAGMLDAIRSAHDGMMAGAMTSGVMMAGAGAYECPMIMP